MKRIILLFLEFIFLLTLALSLAVFVKPGAKIFYKKIPIPIQEISKKKNNFLVQIQISESLYNPDTILLLEDQTFLAPTTISGVRLGTSGVYSIDNLQGKKIDILFNPISASDLSNSNHIYSIYVRPYIVSRWWGAIFFIILFLIFVTTSLADPNNRKIVLGSPLGIVKLWITGTAGITIYRFLINFYKGIIYKIPQIIKSTWNLDSLFSSVIFPMAILAIYCGLYAYISLHLISSGVNFNFTNTLWKLLACVIGIICILFFIITKPKNFQGFPQKFPREKFDINDLLLLLLPLTPVVQFMIINRDVITFIDSLSILVVFLLLSSFVIIIIPFLLGIFSSTKTLMMLGLAFAFTITNMALVSNQFSWYESGNFFIQSLILIAVFLATRYIDKKAVLLFILMFFVANSTLQFFSHQEIQDVTSSSTTDNKLASMVEDRTPVSKPNIYLMVYDAYVPNETLLQYGIDNSEQETYLRDQGFIFYPHNYSVGSSTIMTMSRVLDISTSLHDYPRKAVSGDGIVQNSLKNIGYETWGIFYNDYMFAQSFSSYSFSIPERHKNTYLTEGIFLGEFRFDLGFHSNDHDKFVENKQKALQDIPDNPIFVYSHSNFPAHSQNSGVCLSNETDLFQERLIKANIEMKQDMEVLIENDPDAIIIVAGDHGPYLTKNCYTTTGHYDESEISRLDIQDRYGSFLAIRWPTADYQNYDDITVLQDVFPAVFAYIYNDQEILNIRIDPVTLDNTASNVYVDNGIIHGGVNDGEPLYLSGD